MIIFNDASSGFNTSSFYWIFISVFLIMIMCVSVYVGCGGGGHTFIIFTSFVCEMLGIELRVSYILNQLLLSELHSQAPDRF